MVPVLLVGSLPRQPSEPLPPLAPQLLAFELQVKVVVWPGCIWVGCALNEEIVGAAGAAAALTVTTLVASSLPPGPVQVRL